MRSLNRVFLIGNVGRDPDVRELNSGQRVANFSLATNERWTDSQGNRQERTEWHRIVVFGRLADLVGRYIRKGRRVWVEGRLQTRQYTDRDGQDRYVTEIIAQQIIFLDSASDTSYDVEELPNPPFFDETQDESTVDEEDENLDFLI